VNPVRGHRLILPSGLALLGYLLGRAAFELADQQLDRAGMSTGVASIVPAPVYLAGVLAGLWAATRLAPPLLRELARVLAPSRQALAELAVGVAGAVLLVGAIYAVDLAVGWITLGSFRVAAHEVKQLAAYALLYVLIAVNEEVVFRGVVLGLVARAAGPAWGLLLSSALFAAAHVLDVTSWQWLVGILLLGFLFGELYLMGRSLWLPIGAHWGLQVFGFALTVGLPPVHVRFQASQLLVGRRGSLEEGAVTILIVAVSLLGLALMPRQPEDLHRPSPSA
jgi:membrane protease YdiL (CAAX protease family)